MRKMIEWSVRNSPAVNTLLITVLVVGVGAALTLRRESFPSFQLDFVVVSVPYPGASPTEVEEGICLKVEEAVRRLEGINRIVSIAREDGALHVLELKTSSVDPQRVLNEIRSEVDGVTTFPDLAEDPKIEQVTLRSPAIRIAVIAKHADPKNADDMWKLREVAEKVRDELLELPSVNQVELLAAPDYQIDVEIPEANLRRYGLSLEQVADALRRENVELPGGALRTGNTEYLIRGKNKQLVGTEIARHPVIAQPGGVVLTVGDLGVVKDGFTDEPTQSLVEGKPALVLQVEKTSKEDLLKIVEEVQAYARDRHLPAGYSMIAWGSEWRLVRDRLDMLGRNGVTGLILVFVMLSLFLEIRLSFWVALGMPVAVLGACAVLYVTDGTFNLVSMFAFILALGIVVDDAIVIGENVYTHRERGASPIEAAIEGTLEVFPSVFASVATTIIAFMPLFYVAGVMGKFIAIMPVVVIAMLTISLLEAVTSLPCHLAHCPPSEAQWNIRMRAWVDRWLNAFIDRVYQPTLRWFLDRPATAYASCLAMLLISMGFIIGEFAPFVAFPKVDNDSLDARVIFPNGTPFAVTEAATVRLEHAIREVAKEYADAGKPILNLVYRSIGDVRGRDGPWEDRTGSHVGLVSLDLVPADTRNVHSDEIIAKWRDKVGEIAGVEHMSYSGIAVGPGGRPIEFKLVGHEMDQLEAAVEKVKDRLRTYPGVYDIGDDSNPGKWELRLKIKPEAEAMGARLHQLAHTVRASYHGDEVMRLQRGRHEVKLMVRYPEAERRSLANIDEIRVRRPTGEEVPLPVLADIDVVRGYAGIHRIDQRRSITVAADVDEARANASQIVNDFRANFLPGLLRQYPEIRVRWEGQQQQTTESIDSLVVGFVIASLAMFALLTAEFGSYFQPLIVMAVIPFGLIGAVAGHMCLGLPLTLFSVFGMVALAGVVVNDSIVLVDFINQQRASGTPLRHALEQSGRLRLRAIMLTSVTTIAGLLPLIFEKSLQAQVLIPMATSLCFGLALSTLWVLLLVPVMYQTYSWATEGRPAL